MRVFAVGGLVAAACAAILAALWLTPPSAGLGSAALAGLPETGVANPVTATLLDFRGTDTFLELAVIALAVVGVRALAPGVTAPPPVDSPVARAGAAVLAPVIVVVAGYLLWTGTTKPGGAFQAGAVLAGGLVLLETTTANRPWWRRGAALRWATAAGALAFLAAGLATLAAGLRFLDYPGAAIAYPTILAIESAATASIAVSLSALLAADPERPA